MDIHIKQNPKKVKLVLITVFPNPTANYFKLNFPNGLLTDQIKICLFNFLGVQIFETNLENKDAKINVSNLESGEYIVQLQSPAFKYQTRLIINR